MSVNGLPENEPGWRNAIIVSSFIEDLFFGNWRLQSSRSSTARPRRGTIYYAQVFSQLSDDHFPAAKAIVLVQDNLSPHAPPSLYRVLPPDEAQRIARRFAWHDTPNHGGWLTMVEAELSILVRQILAQRILDIPVRETYVSAWLNRRNKHQVKADWRIATDDARITRKNTYPVL